MGTCRAPAQPQQQPSLCTVMPEMRAGQGSQRFLSSWLESPWVQLTHSTLTEAAELGHLHTK